MSDTETVETRASVFPNRAVYILALIFIFIGLINSTPLIPGWDAMWRGITGVDDLKTRSFSTEWFYPIVFFLMMVVVALKHSMWRTWRGTSRAAFGAFMDGALVLAAFAISLTYLIEIDSVCLIDTVTGERARIMAETLKAEVEFAETMGLPIPDTVEDPKCVQTTGVWLVGIVGIAIVIFLGYNIKVWGLPLVLVSILIASYTIATVMVWYVYGPDGINKYFVTKLGGEPRTFLDGVPNVHDALVNNASGLLGRFMNVIMNVVFPYIILGSLFGKSAGGKVLIKLAFRWTRNLRGGPAHAAIVSSAMFGTISGGTRCERAVHWCVDDPHDDQARVFQGFRGRDGGSRILGRIHHAACNGRCGLCFGGNDGGAVPRGDHCSSLARTGLFPVPIPERIVSIAQTGD